MNTFHLLDLRSQALAVQRLLQGRTLEEKLAWLAAQGELRRVPISDAGLPPVYRFVSRTGMQCVFFIKNDEFVFIEDNTTATPHEPNTD